MARVGALGLAAALLSLLGAAPALADVPVSVSSWATTTSAAGPDGIVLGPDGNLWFTELSANRIGMVTPAGGVSEFPISTAGSNPEAITAGPDGALWFVQPGAQDVGRITTAGTITEVPISVGSCSAGPGDGPVGIASGSDGDLWVTENRDSPGEIAQINPTGDGVTQHCLAYTAPNAIVPGADNALWFTYGEDDVARITTAGSTSAIPTLASSSELMPIVVAPNNDLYVGISPSEIEQLTTGEVATGFNSPSGSTASISRLGVGPDGQIWMAGAGTLTSMSTAGTFASFAGLYPSGDSIAGFAAGPSDTLWMTDATASQIYRVTLGTPQIAAQLSSTSSLATTAATVAGQLLSSGNVPQNVSYQFQYGPNSAYGSSTPSQSATATLAGTPVSAALSGLQPGTTYHYRLVASGCSPSSCSVQSADGTFTTAAAPPPTLAPVEGQSFVVESIRGKIRVRARGGKFMLLTVGESVPTGSEIDARHGEVEIESALTSPQTATGLFSGGLFTVTQPSGGTVTVLKLDSSFKACRARVPATPRHATIAAVKAPPHRSHKVVNQVFGTAHGHYTTRGHYAAAADEGTGWQIADRCDGTYVAVSVGTVQVSDLVRHRSFALKAPHHYLARAR